MSQHAIPVRHFVLHADQDTLRRRIEMEHPVPSLFRLKYLQPYAEAAFTWLHAEAEVIDTTHLTPEQAALHIAEAVRHRSPSARAPAVGNERPQSAPPPARDLPVGGDSGSCLRP